MSELNGTEDIQEGLKEEMSPVKKDKETPDTPVQDEDYKSKFYYLAADMENLKKRHQKDREEFLKYGTESIIKDLLEVMDNLERTLDAIRGDCTEKIKNIYTGINMVKEQFLNVLKNNGLTAIESMGQKFDPNFHEAIGHREDQEKKDGDIAEEYQKGYTLNGRLIRPSKVIVVKNKINTKGE